MPFHPSVFLSYRRNPSHDLARFMHDRLRRMRIDTFFDVENLNGGIFPAAIEREIINRQFFLIILAPITLESEWVVQELMIALKHQKFIIPIETEGFNFNRDIPYPLAALKNYGGIPYDYRAPEQTFKRIASALGVKYVSESQTPPGLRFWHIIAVAIGTLLLIALLITVRPMNSSLGESGQQTYTPEVSNSVQAYPCQGTIVISSGAGVGLNEVKAIPQRAAPSRPLAEQGETVAILAKQHGDGGDWYQISYTNDINVGWIPVRFVTPSAQCPL